MRRVASLAMTILLSLLCVSAGARILDPDNDALVPVLKDKQLERCLEEARIDILLGNQRIEPVNVLLRPLSNYYPTGSFDWSRFHEKTWEKAFLAGVVGVLLARQSSVSCTESTEADCNELKQWLSSPEDKRIFISFTRDDHDAAMKLKDCLSAQKFVVVTYMNEAKRVRYPPMITGELFARTTLKNRLVIDSTAARTSGGVAIEAMCGCEEFLLKLLIESQSKRAKEP